MGGGLQFVAVFSIFVVIYGSEIRVSINGTHSIYNVDSKSPSFAVGMGIFKYGVVNYLNTTKLLTLVKGLGPSYLRMGGTKSDHSHFDPGNSLTRSQERQRNCEGGVPNDNEFSMHMLRVAEWQFEDDLAKKRFGMFENVSYTGSELDDFMSFVKCANWELIFGLNLLDRNEKAWDPTNSLQLLKYAKDKGYHINWELGNEPNSYNHKTGITVSANDVAKAFFQLNNILKSDSWWKQSKIIGPDSNGMSRASSRKYLNKFLHYAGNVVNAATFHQYYMDSRVATVDNFTDPTILDELLPMLKHVTEIIDRQDPDLPVWIGETSSSYGGGAKGLSDTYVAGFMWLDKLGMTASNGIDLVFRQTLLEGNYAMIDDNFDPRPDYWLTLLYKELVGTRVLNVTKSVVDEIDEKHGSRVRIYAHCTNIERTTYPAGSVTIYYLNMSTKNKNLSVAQQGGQNLNKAMTYILTSSPTALNSSDVYLNDEKLELVDIHTLPTFVPGQVNIGAGKKVKMPAMSFGFIVLTDFRIRACL